MFEFTQEQHEKISAWDGSHDCEVKEVGAIGGKMTYCFTPTSLGMVGKVLCACGKELDVTDYGSW